MKKVFISQPMRDKSMPQILRERQQAILEISKLCDESIEIIDSIQKEYYVGANSLWFLSKSIEKLSTADIAYFAEGWEDARGCKIEHDCAVEYGITILKD